MKTSIVVTAEHNAPVYPSEQTALRATGNKNGSGQSSRWAVWITRGDHCQLLAHKFTGLREAEEYALGVARELAATADKDETGRDNQRVVRVA